MYAEIEPFPRLMVYEDTKQSGSRSFYQEKQTWSSEKALSKNLCSSYNIENEDEFSELT